MQITKEQPKSTGKEDRKPSGKLRTKEWKTPILEDVSGRVMAQPYIRFT